MTQTVELTRPGPPGRRIQVQVGPGHGPGRAQGMPAGQALDLTSDLERMPVTGPGRPDFNLKLVVTGEPGGHDRVTAQRLRRPNGCSATLARMRTDTVRGVAARA